MKQQSFTELKSKPILGGTKPTSHLREARTLSTKHWMHIIHKSERATKRWSLRGYHTQIKVKRIYYAKARQYGVRIDKFSNNGNHIHAKIKIQNRELFKAFLKAVGGMIARTVTQARKGTPKGRFWTSIPYVRVCRTQAEVLNLNGYVEANKIEAVFGKKAREIYLEWYQDWVESLKTRPTRRQRA